uniref:Uncharacterized protein n=1 Tax=Romanomermis culicivorax TaxID=13658 RepID=A0A915JUA2_ROMCU
MIAAAKKPSKLKPPPGIAVNMNAAMMHHGTVLKVNKHVRCTRQVFTKTRAGPASPVTTKVDGLYQPAAQRRRNSKTYGGPQKPAEGCVQGSTPAAASYGRGTCHVTGLWAEELGLVEAVHIAHLALFLYEARGLDNLSRLLQAYNTDRQLDGIPAIPAIPAAP